MKGLAYDYFLAQTELAHFFTRTNTLEEEGGGKIPRNHFAAAVNV